MKEVADNNMGTRSNPRAAMETNDDEKEIVSLQQQEPAPPETGDTVEDVEVANPVDSIQDQSKRVPDGGWGWMVVMGAALTHFILVGVARCLGMIYILLRDRYNSTATETAIVAAVFNTMRSITAPLWGMACNRFGCRAVTIVGGLLLSLGFVISAFGSSLMFLIFSFGVLAGTGGAMVFTPAYIMVAQYFDKKKGRAMGFATVGSGLGQVVLAPAINALSQTYALSGTFIILGAIELNNLVSAALYRPLKKPQSSNKLGGTRLDKDEKCQNEGDDATSKQTVSTSQERCSCCRSTKRKFITKCCSSTSLFRNSSFLVYCVLIATMQACVAIFLIFSPSYAKDDLGVENNQAALLVSIFGFADIGGRFMFAFFFDLKRVRHRRRNFYCFISLAFGVMVCVTASMPNFISCAAMAVITGLFEGGCHSQRATILSEFTTKEQAASSVGFLIFSQGLGNIYGPPISGYLRDTTGTNASALYFAGSTYALAAVLFWVEYLFSSKKVQGGACINCSNTGSTNSESCTQ